LKQWENNNKLEKKLYQKN